MTSGADLPQPTASGTLAKTPFPHLLLYLLEKQLTGSIEVMAPDGERATILVLEGFPSKVRTSEATSYLSNVLLEAGILTSDQLEASMQYYRPDQGQLHGQVLLSLGILDMPRLLDGLRRQVVHKLEYLFNWPAETQYAYYDSFDALASYGADDLVTVDPLPLVWGAIKQSPSWEHAHAALSRVGGAPLRVSPTAQIERLGLTPDERQFVELLRPRPRRIYEMTATGTIGPSVKQLLIYCMLIAKQLDILAEDALPPATGGMRRSVPPSQTASQAAVARVQLQPRQVPRPGVAVEEHAAPDSVARRDTRASAPILTPVPPVSADIGAAIAEATRSLEPSAPPPPLPGTAPVESVHPAPLGSPSTSAFPAAVAQRTSVNAPAAPASRPSGMMAAATPPDGSPTSSRAPVSQRDPNLPMDLAVQRAKILQRAEEITRMDYFQMLGVPREASTDDVQKAYFLLAKVWHPDRLPPSIRDVREQCTKVFAHLSEAHQTLTDNERRTHYMTLMKDGGATPDDQAQIAGILEAATNFQKAEVCLRRNDLVQAEQLARAAYVADNKQADYIALVAWLEAMKPENSGHDATEKRIGMLDQAIRLNPKCERAYFYRGMLYKKIGNEKGAHKDFKDAVELNPRNIDATREVRLYAMRKGKGSSPPTASSTGTRPSKKPPEPSGGIFGKLFKK